MNEQVLSIEQMLKLKELGVDTSKASMYYVPKLQPKDDYVLLNVKPIDIIPYIPAFTLEDMLNIMPAKIEEGGCEYRLSIFKLKNGRWFVSYQDDLTCKYLNADWINGESLLSGVYDMFIYLNKYGYLKGGNNERL